MTYTQSKHSIPGSPDGLKAVGTCLLSVARHSASADVDPHESAATTRAGNARASLTRGLAQTLANLGKLRQ